MSKDKFNFNSHLKDLLDGYVKEQRAIGYKYIKGASLLKQLDNFIVKNHLTGKKLPKEIVLLWTEKSPNETDSTRSGRISIVRGFARYMTRMGYEAYIYPSKVISMTRYSYVPYIFTEEEMSKIFIVCDNYKISTISPNRHLVLQLLIRILYGCGLRISEALKLKQSNVNLSEGILSIQDAKFGKERLVPMSQALTERCREYSYEVHRFNSSNKYFFPSPYGGHYSESRIYQLFRGLLWEAGISHSGKGPRLHDFRHTFSVHCLKKWVLAGKDLTNLLPYLSAYLGHVDLRGTQHYLKLTADLYPTITNSLEQHFSNLIPEVKFYEGD